MMKVTMQDVGEYFGYFSHSFEFYRIIENILDCLELPATDEELLEAIDCRLIYTDDQWELMKAYCTPENASFDNAFYSLYLDLLNLLDEKGALRE